MMNAQAHSEWVRWCRSERAHFMRLPGKLDTSGALPQMGKIAADWEVGGHYMPAEIRKQSPKVRMQGLGLGTSTWVEGRSL